MAVEESKHDDSASESSKDAAKPTGKTESASGSISLSALLNVIDGAASHEVSGAAHGFACTR